jgi:hypothetical protein
MSGDDVLLRRTYFKRGDRWFEVRYFGRHIVWVEELPLFLMTSHSWPWLFPESPSLALVKEGPKALILYRGQATVSQPRTIA